MKISFSGVWGLILLLCLSHYWRRPGKSRGFTNIFWKILTKQFFCVTLFLLLLWSRFTFLSLIKCTLYIVLKNTPWNMVSPSLCFLFSCYFFKLFIFLLFALIWLNKTFFFILLCFHFVLFYLVCYCFILFYLFLFCFIFFLNSFYFYILLLYYLFCSFYLYMLLLFNSLFYLFLYDLMNSLQLWTFLDNLRYLVVCLEYWDFTPSNHEIITRPNMISLAIS